MCFVGVPTFTAHAYVSSPGPPPLSGVRSPQPYLSHTATPFAGGPSSQPASTAGSAEAGSSLAMPPAEPLDTGAGPRVSQPIRSHAPIARPAAGPTGAPTSCLGLPPMMKLKGFKLQSSASHATSLGQLSGLDCIGGTVVCRMHVFRAELSSQPYRDIGSPGQEPAAYNVSQNMPHMCCLARTPRPKY